MSQPIRRMKLAFQTMKMLWRR